MFFTEWTALEGSLYATLFFWVRYLLFAGVLYAFFYHIWRKRFKAYKIQGSSPNKKQIWAEIGYSLLTFAIYGCTGWQFLGWMNAGETLRYEAVADFGHAYLVFSVFLMVVVHDAYFYWTHRLMHLPWVYPYVHRTHHGFHTPTPWAAFAFHPLETLISVGIVPIIIYCIPYHPLALVCFFTLMTGHNVCLHLGYRIPGMWWSSLQNTTKDHDYHHKKGHGNYGLYFTVWDKMMGTYSRQR